MLALWLLWIPACLTFNVQPQYLMSPRHQTNVFISNNRVLLSQLQQPLRRSSPLFALYNKNKKNIRQDKPIPRRSTKKAPPTDVNLPKKSAPTFVNLPGVVQVTSLSNDLVSIELCIPGEITQEAYVNACASASKNMHIPGFPRGAALPQSLVELMNGKDTLRTQAVTVIVSDLIAANVEPALRLNDFDPVLENPPRLTLTYEQLASAHYKPGEPLVFTVECDVIPPPEPEPVLPLEPDSTDVSEPWTTTYASAVDYDDVPVEELLVRSDPTAWNRELYESMQAEFADLVPVLGDYELRLGDACEVHLTGYPILPDGNLGLPLPSGKGGNVLGDRVTVLLKGGKYMPGLVEGLIGRRTGDRITLFVNFPKVRDHLFFFILHQFLDSPHTHTLLLFCSNRRKNTDRWRVRKLVMMLKFCKPLCAPDPSPRCSIDSFEPNWNRVRDGQRERGNMWKAYWHHTMFVGLYLRPSRKNFPGPL
jgi:Bacterial trigger factor protein (TF)